MNNIISWKGGVGFVNGTKVALIQFEYAETLGYKYFLLSADHSCLGYANTEFEARELAQEIFNQSQPIGLWRMEKNEY